MDQKKKVLDLIKRTQLAVISSINSSGKPESAVIGIGETENLELILGTPNTTRKYKNIKSNPNVSLVIGWDEAITVQFEGVATEIDYETNKDIIEAYFKKNPTALRFKDDPNETYFKVTPNWIRYSDLKTGEIFEINEFN